MKLLYSLNFNKEDKSFACIKILILHIQILLITINVDWYNV